MIVLTPRFKPYKLVEEWVHRVCTPYFLHELIDIKAGVAERAVVETVVEEELRDQNSFTDEL